MPGGSAFGSQPALPVFQRRQQIRRGENDQLFGPGAADPGF